MEVLKISSKSNPNSVAGAIAGLVKESNKAEMQAIGAGALNQAIKAVAIARGFVAPSGVDLVCVPAFAEVEVEGEDRTRNKDSCRVKINYIIRGSLKRLLFYILGKYNKLLKQFVSNFCRR